MILVTGASGNVGRATVSELAARGERVRAFVRDAARAPERAEVAVGNFEDRASIARAMADVERILLSSADGPRKADHEMAVIDAAAAAGVELIVKASAIGAEAGSPLPPWDWNGRIEDHLEASGVPWAVLRSNFYMTNLLGAAPQVAEARSILAPAGRGRVGIVDPRDTGTVAAAILAEGGRGVHVVTGPAAIGYGEMAEAIGSAIDQEVAFVDVPPQGARAAFAEAGMPGWLVDHLDRLFGLIRDNELATVTTTMQELTGRKPRSFQEFARDHAAVFREEPVTA